MGNIFQGMNILVTGGTGSIGSEVVRKVLQYEPKVVRVFSSDEDGLFCLEKELKTQPNVRFLLGDIKEKERLRMAIEDIDLVFHAAALKHVPLCEYNPFEAVKTNVLGTQNLIEVARDEEIDKMITISTDKAVNPVNVMGATKLLAERLTISANYYKGIRKTIFACVRFGNVLNSRGSVVPLFREQISGGGPVTITDPDMTRFVTSVSRAAEMVLQAAEITRGGEIFILKMPALRIGDLAEVMIEGLATCYGHKPEKIKIEILKKRPGEKNHEELMTQDEAQTAYETSGMFIITPRLTPEKKTRIKLTKRQAYISSNEELLTKTEIKKLFFNK